MQQPAAGRLSEDGRASFRTFTKAVTMKQVERVRGSNQAQERFRQLLASVRNGYISPRRLPAAVHPPGCIPVDRGAATVRRNRRDSLASHDAEQEVNLSKLRELGRPTVYGTTVVSSESGHVTVF